MNTEIKYEKLNETLHYMVRNEDGTPNGNTLKNGPINRNTRYLTNAAGKYRKDTLLNYEGFTIEPPLLENDESNRPPKAQVNEHARIQTSNGYLDLWGTYDDPNFGSTGDVITSIRSAVFRGVGTGIFKDATLARITYDNDGTVLGRKSLRQITLFKEITDHTH